MFAVRDVSCVQYVTLKNPLVVFADEVCAEIFTGICEIQLSSEIDLQLFTGICEIQLSREIL